MGHSQTVPFRLIGQLEGYILSESGKVSSLRLGIGQDVHTVKLNQTSRFDLLRGILEKMLQRGSWVEVTGFQKISPKGILKGLKAEHIVPLSDEASLSLVRFEGSLAAPSSASPVQTPTKILVCQKSACCKRGSGKVQGAIEAAIRDRGLEATACVKAVGCLKQCSKGPNIVIGKTQYRNVSAKDIALLLDQHFEPLSCPIIAVA